MTTPEPAPARTPERVRVTSSRRGAVPVGARPPARDLEEQTVLGDVYLAGLMRAQLRLSVAVLALTVVGLSALPLVVSLVPATQGVTLFGIPFPWLGLGVAVYPAAWLLARWYVRQSERLEADFAEVVETP